MALALDFAVTHPLQPLAFTADYAGARLPGSWATKYGETHKNQFVAPCLKAGADFKPMIVETYGTWAPAARELLDEIATQYAVHQGGTASAAANILFQRLSVTLMRLNARMLLARAPIGFTDEEPLGYTEPCTTDNEDLWEADNNDAVPDDEVRF
jgi:hypothetical protein